MIKYTGILALFGIFLLKTIKCKQEEEVVSSTEDVEVENPSEMVSFNQKYKNRIHKILVQALS